MARNKVQFQKGLSMAEFNRRYGTEEQCHAALIAMRWPDGFVCPKCGGSKHGYCGRSGAYSSARRAACRRRHGPEPSSTSRARR